MKSLSVKLGVILIGLLIFVIGCPKTTLRNEPTKGADWKFYGGSDNYLGCYDTQSITRPSKNIVRVWVRQYYTEKGVIDYVGGLGKKYENLSHTKIVLEIDCAEKTIHNLSFTDYDNKGRAIYSDSSPSKWIFIPPKTVAEGLYEEVCK